MKSLLRLLFRFLARIILRRHKPTVIGVAGSLGKTGTKDAIAAALVPPDAHGSKNAKEILTPRSGYRRRL